MRYFTFLNQPLILSIALITLLLSLVGFTQGQINYEDSLLQLAEDSPESVDQMEAYFDLASAN